MPKKTPQKGRYIFQSSADQISKHWQEKKEVCCRAQMASNLFCSGFMLALALVLWACIANSLAQDDPSRLSLDHYSKTCPRAQEIVRAQVECAVRANSRDAASILRLHFHDCFVQGCDGSVLLDDTVTLIGEKQGEQNVNSLRGFDIVDKIKEELEAECPGVVSCADLLAIAARDAVVLAGGPYWDVPVGRLDSKTASLDQANTDIPKPQQGLVTLIAKFHAKGLSTQDLVALIGAHTIGMSRCASFRDRIYGDLQLTSNHDPVAETQLSKLKDVCPLYGGGDDNIAPMDYFTPTVFDNAIFETLLKGSGLLNSDQEMYSSIFAAVETAKVVEKYWADPLLFFKDFSNSMVKMGNITNPEGGEVRTNCRFVNT